MIKLKIWSSFLFICFFSFSMTAQNWLAGGGGATNDEALDIASDTVGNYYVTGYYTSQARFGAATLVSNGNSDIFIAKYNSAGVIQWAVTAGGNKADRAYSIKADNSGNVYVTGFYYGSATFGASTINSVSGSQDVFIAKYNTSGTLMWVRTVGGSDAETGNGITVDKIGNVIVTGQFKAASTFGTTTLTSANNSVTGLPSFDIFTTKWDAAGNFLWVKQGKAKYDDRGLDVGVDDANNIFVVGQFSDTIQFDIVHNNSSMNAGYVLKYDQNGNEQWFIKMSAQQTMVNSIAIDLNNNVLITGDYKGNLTIYATPAVSTSGSYLYKLFIAKISNSGAVIWVDNDGSDNEVVSKSIALDNQGNAYIAGLFKCKFDEYSANYGDGIFYSSGYRDVFVTKYSAAGTREWFKQFGSNRDDYCSGIAVKLVDKPVIAGSFENRFHIPFSPAFTIFNTNGHSYSPWSGIGYCSNPNYEEFITQKTAGQKDIFIASAVDITSDQAPFDYFERTGSAGCQQNFISPCIGMCEDTVCVPIYSSLHANLFEIILSNQSGPPSAIRNETDSVGAQYNYTWSAGSQSNYSNPISTSGLYSLKSERKDGCFQDQDSVYAYILEAPWITDSYSINVNQPPQTKRIKICGEDTVTLWGTHRTFADSVGWSGPSHIVLNDSTIKVTKSGVYDFSISSSAGCTISNKVEVLMDTFALHSLLDPHIVFYDTILEATDTIRICEGNTFGAKAIDSAFYSINKDTIPFKYVEWTITSPGGLLVDSTKYVHTAEISIQTTGSYTINNTLYNHCADSVVFPFSRTFYVIVYPKPVINLNITGPSNACPADTVTLYATGNVANFVWSGNNIVRDFHDSIWVTVPEDNDEIYMISADYTDSITGCSDNAYSRFTLHPRTYPHVAISPSDGIICPNDSALLTCEPGINYYWVSPSGDNIGTTQSIYVSVPGNYHCIQTAADGCILTSNFVEAKEYNVPYLEVLPSNNICPNGSAEISVQASDLALIQWQAPLSGNSATQTVSAAGTYSCHITQCGILTIASVVITQSSVPSYITASDSIVCPGDTLLLNGNGGMVSYNWVSQNSGDSYLYITQPGSYILETTDADGCVGVSAPFTVTTKPQAVAPSVSDTTICRGQSINISATASDSILWFNTASGGIPIYIGDTYTTPVIDSTTNYYVQTYARRTDLICKSSIVPVHVDLFPSSLLPRVAGSKTLCLGSALNLSALVSNVNYTWTGPAGFTSTSQNISINPLTTANQGVYTLRYDDINCTSVIDSFFVTVVSPPSVISSGISSICSGVALNIPLNASVASTYSWVASNNPNTTGESLTTNTTSNLNDNIINTTTSVQSVIYTITPTSIMGLCVGTPKTYTVVVNFGPQTNFGSSSTICDGTAINTTFSSSIPSTYSWVATDHISTTGESLIAKTSTTLTDTIYSSSTVPQTIIYSITPTTISTGCVGLTESYSVTVIPDSAPDFQFSHNACIYKAIFNDASASSPVSWFWDFGDDSTSVLPNPTHQYSTEGKYNVTLKTTTVSGCKDSISVEVDFSDPIVYVNSDTITCVGKPIQLYAFGGDGSTYIWSPSINLDNPFSATPTATLAVNTTYTVLINAVTPLGDVCPQTDTTSVQVTDASLYSISATVDNDTILSGRSTLLHAVTDSILLVNWAPSEGLSNIHSFNPIASPLVSTTYTVSILDAEGCPKTATILIFVRPGSCDFSDIFVPNTFTPNNDNSNDFLYVRSKVISEHYFAVYDRWGRMVFETADIDKGWDGKYKGEEADPAVFVWYLRAKCYNGEELQKKGNVTLVR